VRALAAVYIACALCAACAGGPRRHAGPPPEYERPQVPEWDAGKPVDPLEKAMAEGEPVDEPELPDAAPDRPSGEDAGAR
jgi:hypothetical protein